MGKHRHAEAERRTLTGVVREFNLSPKGAFEGALLDTPDGVVQVNFPPGAVPPGLSHGGTVTVLVEPDYPAHEHPAGDHPVVSLVEVRGPDGRPTAAGPARAAGTVRRLNYARHGEPNGVVLDTGDFVHLKPDGMRRVGLVVGDRVEAEGDARPAAGGGRVIEAAVVNGTPIKPGKKHHI